MSGDTYRTTVDIAAPPDAVFAHFTRPEALLTWMGEHAVLQPSPGGTFLVDINGVPVRGTYLIVEHPHRLVISWGHAGSTQLPPGSSTVEITLTPTTTGTRLDIVHSGLPPAQATAHAAGWLHFLDRLTAAATGANPGPDPWARDHTGP